MRFLTVLPMECRQPPSTLLSGSAGMERKGKGARRWTPSVHSVPAGHSLPAAGFSSQDTVPKEAFDAMPLSLRQATHASLRSSSNQPGSPAPPDPPVRATVSITNGACTCRNSGATSGSQRAAEASLSKRASREKSRIAMPAVSRSRRPPWTQLRRSLAHHFLDRAPENPEAVFLESRLRPRVQKLPTSVERIHAIAWFARRDADILRRRQPVCSHALFARAPLQIMAVGEQEGRTAGGPSMRAGFIRKGLLRGPAGAYALGASVRAYPAPAHAEPHVCAGSLIRDDSPRPPQLRLPGTRFPRPGC